MNHLAKCKPVHFSKRFILFVSFLTVLVIPGCRSSQPSESPQPESVNQGIISAVPPFTTKEPERYQATRTVTFNEWTPGAATTRERINRVLIARDGNSRREEYFDQGGEQLVYLETSAGRFVLLPSSNLYAPLNESEGLRLEYESSDVSPNLLLNEQSTAAYENLGAEIVNDRMTTKYRVTSTNKNEDSGGRVETLIWIDESIGMPIRSETTSGNAERSARVIMELKDIKLEVDRRLFALPANYRRVESRLIWERIYGAR